MATNSTQDRPSGRDRPLTEFEETLSTLTTNDGTAFRIRGDGTLCVFVTCPDTTSAVGTFVIKVGDTAAGTFSPALDVPQLPKSAGTALTMKPLILTNPGGNYAKAGYVRTSGGALAEATIKAKAW